MRNDNGLRQPVSKVEQRVGVSRRKGLFHLHSVSYPVKGRRAYPPHMNQVVYRGKRPVLPTEDDDAACKGWADPGEALELFGGSRIEVETSGPAVG